MRCTSYALADYFDLSAIALKYSDQSWPTPYRDALHMRYSQGDVFLFSYGCLVFWNLTLEEEKALVLMLEPHATAFTYSPEIELVNFEWGDTVSFHRDMITLPKTESFYGMLAMSYGLAQQIKLSVFENSIEDTISKTSHIPKSLALNGRIPLSRKKMSQMIGDLFIMRSYINLKSDILDIPDFFWEFTELEHYYHRVAKYFNVAQRTDVLNKRCTIIHELFQMIGEELNNRHASLLEIIIIVLISAEIVISLCHWLF